MGRLLLSLCFRPSVWLGITSVVVTTILGAFSYWSEYFVQRFGTMYVAWMPFALTIVAIGTGIVSLIRTEYEQEKRLKAERDRNRRHEEQLAREKNVDALEPLRIVLMSLHLIIETAKNLRTLPEKKKADFRLGLFIACPGRPGKAIQLFNYDGGEPRNPTIVDIGPGIAGRAFESNQPAYDTLPSDRDFDQHMVDSHGFTYEHAASMNSTRRAWLAIPGGVPGKVLCVLLCDSRDPMFFESPRNGESGKKNVKIRANGTIPKTIVVKLLVGATSGIVRLILLGYKQLSHQPEETDKIS